MCAQAVDDDRGRIISPADRHSTKDIVGAYQDVAVRAYCAIRFRIIKRRFLDEIVQYLPRTGRILEFGCGFGLFGVYFARELPGASVVGVDMSRRRIRLAEMAARRLGLRNAAFACGDAVQWTMEGSYDAVYMLDLVHHLPPALVVPFLRRIYDHLSDDGVLIIKDVDTHPWWQLAFTWILDVLMTRGEIPHYLSGAQLARTLRACGFQVFSHSLVDVLPYPHRLYFCSKGRIDGLLGASAG